MQLDLDLGLKLYIRALQLLMEDVGFLFVCLWWKFAGFGWTSEVAEWVRDRSDEICTTDWKDDKKTWIDVCFSGL